ncbi:hypothetical protein F5Y04DRAFT_254289 [Hypomontagnella monticulosa]|nr:hypothetical protein F5Y04DRAFT_254289 [Hypomontagnella monticulosa]
MQDPQETWASRPSSMASSDENSRSCPIFWDEKLVPGKQDVHFQKFVTRAALNDSDNYKNGTNGDFSSAKRYTPGDEDCSVWNEHPDPQCSFSFGDQGTKATVNAYGQLMQFSSYLGIGHTGMFSADQESTNEPFLERHRAEQLENLARSRDQEDFTYGLQFDDLQFDDEPERKYVHSQWPRYEFKSTEAEMTIQWMVHDEFVLQQCIVTNLSEIDRSLTFTFAKDMLIRDLDYIDDDYSYNDYNMYNIGVNEDKNHCSIGPNGYSWTCAHAFDSPPRKPPEASRPGNKGETDAVGVVVSIFVNGIACNWKDSTWTRNLKGKSAEATTSNGSNTIEVTTAYKMIHMNTSETDWTKFLIPADAADIAILLHEAPFCALELSRLETTLVDTQSEATTGDAIGQGPGLGSVFGPIALPTEQLGGLSRHLDYVLQRNLEHILSVCSVTLTRGDIKAVALTCGDVSGHRICTSASFFAFRFLLDVVARLRSIRSDHPYIQSLLARIKAVCKGHLAWLKMAMDQNASSDIFEWNYYVNGTKRESTSPNTPEPSRNDTPFQIIKVANFITTYNDDEDRKSAKDFLVRLAKLWVIHLRDLDQREIYVWPHSGKEGFMTYRLDDHVWIYEALKQLEGLGISEYLSSDTEKDERGIDQIIKKFAPGHIQGEFLQRFTATNQDDSSGKKLLAVTRSVRESRFMFHARDTALFYNIDCDNTPFSESWENTIQAQADHTENQDINWDNSLRYGLAIVMATRKYKINKRTPTDMIQTAVKVIFKAIQPNGFLGGQLNKNTKIQKLFSGTNDIDFYFHASFEIPHILLTQSYLLCKHFERWSNPTLPRRKTEPDMFEQLKCQPRTHKLESDSLQIIDVVHNEGVGNEAVDKGKVQRETRTMKKIIPFHNQIDSRNIAELEDEWLYNFPQCFWRNKTIEILEVLRPLRQQIADDPESCGKVVATGLHNAADTERAIIFTRYGNMFSGSFGCAVFDTGRRKFSGGREKRPIDSISRCFSNDALWRCLKMPRTVKDGKKRLVWMPNADAQAAMLCYLHAPESDKAATSLFFDRHSNYENYFFEDTNRFLNAWETELHLSFYTPINPRTPNGGGIPAYVVEKFPGFHQRILTRASMGFRFEGDFLDRYWTCYFVEYTPHNTSRNIRELLSKDRSQRQRRVLELILLDSILKILIRGTDEIFDLIHTQLGVNQGGLSASILHNDEYYDKSQLWREYQRILQIVQEDLERSAQTILEWNQREEGRRSERPRWTRNDERKYRTTINKLTVITNRKIRNLTDIHKKVVSLKEALKSSQEQLRNELSHRESRNILYFTYVTVVFLPLGFATSLFSMSNTPDGALVGSMAICAAVAFIITVTALFNAPALVTILRAVRSMFETSAQYSRFTTLDTQESNPANNTVKPSKPRTNSEPDPESGENTGNSSSVPQLQASKVATSMIVFWLVYFCIELPARRVFLGLRALDRGDSIVVRIGAVLGGILFLPLFIFSWSAQLLWFNLVDLLRLLKELATPLVAKLASFAQPSKEDETAHLVWLENSLKAARPLAPDARKKRVDGSNAGG